MLGFTAVGAVFLLVVVASAVGIIAWLLSGASFEVRSRPVRASATSETAGDASGSDPRAPTPVATPERPGP